MRARSGGNILNLFLFSLIVYLLFAFLTLAPFLKTHVDSSMRTPFIAEYNLFESCFRCLMVDINLLL